VSVHVFSLHVSVSAFELLCSDVAVASSTCIAVASSDCVAVASSDSLAVALLDGYATGEKACSKDENGARSNGWMYVCSNVARKKIMTARDGSPFLCLGNVVCDVCDWEIKREREIMCNDIVERMTCNKYVERIICNKQVERSFVTIC
jgi:hypothetical protein